MSRRGKRRALGAAAVALFGVAAIALAGEQMQQKRQLTAQAVALTHGDPETGRALIQSHGCGGCHQIPGVTGARGKVGPPLKGISGRAFIAGRLENTPDNLMHWIDDPKAIDPRTAMPDVGVDDAEARDIAAYLYTLK
ncbi:MAG TPA: c-type cytochrome [Caulobacteraceae bacterium]|jgi:cytochrome c2